MKPAPFVHHAPKTVGEAVSKLAEVAPDGGRVLAGGQSLVPIMAFRLARPPHLVDINGIESLQHLERQGSTLVIGAGVRHAAFHSPAENGPLGKLLSIVSRHIAHYPIRMRGTFCGSLAHADPAAEWALVCATIGAELIAASIRGRRTIAIGDFFRGIMTTALDDDELLLQVRLPILPPDMRCGFYEFSRRAGDFAVSMALVTYRLSAGVVIEARVGVGGAEVNPRRIPEAEAALIGHALEPERVRSAAIAAADCVDPMDDVHASADFRRNLVREVVNRAFERAPA